MKQLIERLREFEAKVIKDWRYSYNGMFEPPSVCAISVTGNNQQETERKVYPICTVTSGDSEAKLIAEMRNALPLFLTLTEHLHALINAVDHVTTQDKYLEPFLRENLEKCRDALEALEQS